MNHKKFRKLVKSFALIEFEIPAPSIVARLAGKPEDLDLYLDDLLNRLRDVQSKRHQRDRDLFLKTAGLEDQPKNMRDSFILNSTKIHADLRDILLDEMMARGIRLAALSVSERKSLVTPQENFKLPPPKTP